EGLVTGNITLEIWDDVTEPGSAVLNSSGGGTRYLSLLIYPISSGISISGDISGPMIDLSGADNVTIDGRVDRSGSADLVITNTSTSNGSSASTIRFIESANTNTIQYCYIYGSETNATSGIILFSTASTGSGNDGNIIDNNYITIDSSPT
ncbi:unnamed protein product, partial [marine sediment metagenome]